MEPLFMTKTKIEFEDCYALTKFWVKKSRVTSWIFAVLCLLEVVICIHTKYYKGIAFFLIAAVFLVTWGPFCAKKNAEKMYRANKYFYEAEQTIKFYENKLIKESEISGTELEYSELGKIYEINTHFFIMQSNTHAVCIKKENCSAELREFIRKVGNDNGTYVYCGK